MIHIEIFSNEGKTEIEQDEEDVTEYLRKFGLEYKTADYLHNQTVSIVLTPVQELDQTHIKTCVRNAMESLENTGIT